MFNPKSRSEQEGAPSGSATIIAAGTTVTGDLSSSGDIRIDGSLKGNINSTAKVVIGANGLVEGDIQGQQADIMGQVKGTVRVKELLQLKGSSQVDGNIHAAKLQIEPTAQFNGQCHMTESATASSTAKSSSNSSAASIAVA